MNKILSLTFGVLVALTSCQKSSTGSSEGGDLVPVSVVATIEGSDSASRAYGDGTSINRCIVEVYTSSGTLFQRSIVAPSSNVANFELQLVSSQDYTFVLWADNVEMVGETPTAAELEVDKHYTTTNGLKAISMVSPSTYSGNDETKDAFFATSEEQVETKATEIDLTLKRPFGEVNVTTGLTGVTAEFIPSTIKVSYSTELYTALDASTGELSSTQPLTWSGDVAGTYSVGDESLHLVTEYVFAPYVGDNNDKEILVFFEMEFYDANGTLITTNDKFDSMPIKRNYRTNITGELLTVQGTITATIDPLFENDDIDENIN
ncbi:MAG: DUF6562 domain-containing protein [Rikenellaceae bacterium]